MQRNRSLKEISFLKHRFLQQKVQNSQICPSPNNISNNGFKFNLDNPIKYISKIQISQSIKKIKKYDLSARSHKNINIKSARQIYGLSEKKKQFANNTQRNKKSSKQNQQNVCVSKFQIASQIKTTQLEDLNKKILSPSNRLLGLDCQPKRPKILNKKYNPLFHEQFKLGKVLGKGRFGNVFVAQHIATKSLYAVKQISLQKVCSKLVERLIWEIKIQLFIKQENCLQLYKFYKQDNNIFLILQLGQQSLFDLLRQKKYFTQKEVAYYIRQTIQAFIYLHQRGIIHRDLKPQNIVLINNTVKLADFGWSIYIGQNDKRKTFCGTLDYVCPQIVLGSQYDEMVDVWSIGVLCYELSTGHAPFQSSKSKQDTYKRIVNIDLKYPKYLSSEIKDFISKLLMKNPEKRMSLNQALEHPWLKRFQKK